MVFRRGASLATIGLLSALLAVSVFTITPQAYAQEAASSDAKEVEALRASLKEAEGKLAGLQGTLDGATTKIKAHQAEVGAAASREEGLKTRISELERALADTQSEKSEASSGELLAAQQKADAAVAEAAELRAAKTAAETAASSAQSALKGLEAERDDLKARVKKAEGLSPQLAKATADLAAAQAALAKSEADAEAAEARADDTQKLADSLLAQHYNEWVPHWVADNYERRVRPAAVAAWENADSGSRKLYRTSSKQAGKLWEAAGPNAHYYAAYTKDIAANAHEKVLKHPHIAAAKARVAAAYGAVANSKPAKFLAAHASRTHKELEAIFARFLRQHPLLAPLAAAGTIGWVVTTVLALPLLILALPLLFSSKKRKPEAQPTSSSTARSDSARKAKKVRA